MQLIRSNKSATLQSFFDDRFFARLCERTPATTPEARSAPDEADQPHAP